jgi:hypothetical protein
MGDGDICGLLWQVNGLDDISLDVVAVEVWVWELLYNLVLCNILQGASVILHIILLGVGGTIYNTHTLEPFTELGLDS